MSDDRIDEAKGRLKEAAGDLTDDEGLKREGKVDRAAGSIKEKFRGGFDKAKDAVDDIADKAKDKVNRDDDRDERPRS
jgi:uncharacterized protein YjbJ (UPF0337 family)